MDKPKPFKAGKYCPVCEKVYREDLDFCPVHPTVLMVRIRDWGEGFKIFVTQGYDEKDDDFKMDEGLDSDLIEGARGLSLDSVRKSLMGKEIPNPLIAEWKRRQK